ncbi:MAG: hypothetical protein COA80_04495 [Leeuwenhoekiella sp.]|nr:MAG: hypothetical protein COA80_04495 [Leeuwenhoekiella sp.]
MIRPFLFVILSLLLVSCADDVTFNTPAFQGIKDTLFFKAAGTRAQLTEANEVIISGSLNGERVDLKLPAYGTGVFDLSAGSLAMADFYEADGKQYSTRFDGEGEVVVERVDDSLYTGSFRFRAVAPADTTVVYFTRGYFYEVPFFKEPPPPVIIPVVESAFGCKIQGNMFRPEVTYSSEGNGIITGVGSTNSVIVRLRFPRNIQPGVYDLTDFNVNSPYQASYISGAFNPQVQSGTVTIISNNINQKSVGGTFEFTAQGAGTIQVTEGFFGFNY